MDENGYQPPVVKELVFSAPGKISWVTPNEDKLQPPAITRFDFRKIPSRSIDFGNFRPFSVPPESKPFDTDALPDSSFSLDDIPLVPFKVQNYLLELPAPAIVRLPVVQPDDSLGVISFGVPEGLPGKKTMAIIKDRDGFTWMIIDQLLYRYSGTQLEQINLPGKPKLFSLYLNRQGEIIASDYNNSDIFFIDTRKMIIRKISGLPGIGLIVFFEDSHDRYWIGTLWNGLLIADFNKNEVRQFRKFPENDFRNTFFSGFIDGKKRTWLATAQGVIILDSAQRKARRFGKNEGLPSNEMVRMQEDKHGRIWITCLDLVKKSTFGVTVIDPGRRTLTMLGASQGVAGSGWTMSEDSLHNHWLMGDSQLLVVDDGLRNFKRIALPRKFVEEWPGDLFTDPSGMVWAGNVSGSIDFFPLEIDLLHLNHSTGLTGSRVWGLREDRHGDVWVGGTRKYLGDRAWLNLIDSARTKLYDYSPLIDSGVNSVNAIIEDSTERYMLSFFGEGLKLLDRQAGTIKTWGAQQGLAEKGVFSLLKDKKGNYWIGTESGIYILEKNADVVRYMTVNGEGYLPKVYSMVEDGEGRIWTGSLTDGVGVIDPDAGEIRMLNSNGVLSDDHVNSIILDNQQRIWIATDNGLNLIDSGRTSIQIFSTSQGLVNKSVYTVLWDGEKLMAGTENGLSILRELQKEKPDKKTKAGQWQIQNFGRYQGFPFNDYNSNVSLHTRRGEDFFGISFSVLSVIKNLHLDTVKPDVSVSGIFVLDKKVNVESFVEHGLEPGDTIRSISYDRVLTDSALATAAAASVVPGISWSGIDGRFYQPVGLEIPFDQNMVSFSYHCFTNANANAIQYRYVLEGADRKWSELTSDNFTENYRDLAPGNYTFKVRARGLNYIWSDPAVISFTVLPPWWRTLWAYSLYAALICGVFISFARYRSRKLREENMILEAKVKESTMELRKSLENLRSAQTQLIHSEKMAGLGELTAGIAHEIQNPLNFVNNFSEVNGELVDELSEEMENGSKDAQKELLAEIRSNNEKIAHHGKRAGGIVKSMLQHSRTQAGVKEPANLNAIADEYLRLAYHGMRAKDNTFNATLETELDPRNDSVNIIAQDIGRVLLNLFNNAFYAVAEKKKTEPSFQPKVKVITSRDEHDLIIKVIDNGTGMTEQVRSKIFQPFFTTKPTGQGTGLGMSLSYDIITKGHNGQFSVQSAVGEGSVFEIRIPY